MSVSVCHLAEDHDYQYDVAISFLTRDQNLASMINDQLRNIGFDVFFYPRSQEKLAATNGLETMRQPFYKQSRVVVVLYRSEWGNTPWTRIECTAIQDRFLQCGHNFLFFISVGTVNQFPPWLPEFYVRFNLADFPLNEALGVIKAKVLEANGKIPRLDPIQMAKSISLEQTRRSEKEKLFRSVEWINGNVLPSLEKIFKKISDISDDISSCSGIVIQCDIGERICGITNGMVSLEVRWRQQYINVIGDIFVSGFSCKIILPSEKSLQYIGDPPHPIRQLVYKPDLSFQNTLSWVNPNYPLSSYDEDAIADEIIKGFLEMVNDDNKGKIDRTPDWVKKSRDERDDW